VSLAFFDLDKTLCRKDTGELIAWPFAQRWLVHPVSGVRFLAMGVGYKLGWVPRARMQEIGFSTYRGNDPAYLAELLAELWEPRIAPHLSPVVLERVRGHQQQGMPVVVVTASPDFLVAPAREALGLDRTIGSTMEVGPDGRLTGRPVDPCMEGPEKARVAAAVAAERGMDLATCWAYTDSIVDLALLEAVGNPVAVGPDPELRVVAVERGWEILEH
jgi:HAD superfamily hydrolase (TIGR01490 family)